MRGFSVCASGEKQSGKEIQYDEEIYNKNLYVFTVIAGYNY